MFPIKGIRYKCSVLKDFDFCAMCEERRGHEHAFLKIYKPEQVPKAMFTIIDENTKNAKPDIEMDVREEDQFPTFFRNMVGNFMNRGNHGNHHHGNRGGFRGPWGRGPHCGMKRQWQEAMGGQGWRNKKAVLVSEQQEPLIAKPGDIIFASIEVKNEMMWSWSEGASLQSMYNEAAADAFEELALPIDFPVKENSSFKLDIPITVRSNAFAGEYDVVFSFHGKRGDKFGSQIPIKVKIEATQLDEGAALQMALKLYQEQGAKEMAFEKIVELVKAANGDMAIIKSMMQPLPKPQAKEE